jgi:galactose-1-phosphate uridylyltransferase
MTKVKTQARQRNWVAKHNVNRPARHRDHTQYQRRDKHQPRAALCSGS